MSCPDPNGFCWDSTSSSPPAQDTIVDSVFGELNPPGAHQPMLGSIQYRDPHAASCP